MSLNYEFAPVDVAIMTHPKAFKAGIEAMGLWMWGVTYVKFHKTAGVVHRDAAFGALGGKDNVTLAQRLVASGLWLEREDGDFEVWNHAKKAPKLGPDGRTAGARRTKKWRERQAANDTSPSPSQPVTESVTRDVSPSTSISPSGSGSSLGSREQPTGPPEWFHAAAATADQAGAPSADADLPSLWVRFQGSDRWRQGRRTQGDAAAWLITTIKGDRRKDTGAPRSGRADTRQPLGDPSQHEWLKRAASGENDL